jgi:hypothetical protein
MAAPLPKNAMADATGHEVDATTRLCELAEPFLREGWSWEDAVALLFQDAIEACDEPHSSDAGGAP